MSSSEQFDVFLAHSSEDKPQVRIIARKLRERGLKPWLDEEQIASGELFQSVIQKAISQIKAAAIIIGSTGLGRWQVIELQALISQFVDRGIRVIPVLLPDVERIPDDLFILKQFNWVSFANIDDGDAFYRLEWGITGGKPSFKMATLTIQKEQRTAQYFREKLGNEIELDLILVHGGNFLMGSPETEEEHHFSQSPQHSVTVKSFFLGRYPVTQAQWRIVAETYDRVNIELNPDPSHFKGAKRPVEQVSWYEAQEFCDRLAKKTKRQYRLPTESEWEYTCRAGTTTPFYFGNTLSTELANYDGNSTYANGVKGKYRQETTTVDHFDIANAWGLCDMHGNVYEWCQDHWHSYYGAFLDGSAWVTDNSDAPRVRRGGSWLINPRHCRSAFRDNYNPAHSNDHLGFRVSCSAPATLQHPTDQS